MFMVRTCEFPRDLLSIVDHRIMNTLDARFRRPRTHVTDTVDDSRQWPQLSLVVDRFLGVIRWMLAAAGAWIRDLGSSTQLGPDPEQVTGRRTGVRT